MRILISIVLASLVLKSQAQDTLKNYCLSCQRSETKDIALAIQKVTNYQIIEGVNKKIGEGISYMFRNGADSIEVIFQGSDRFNLKAVYATSLEAISNIYSVIFGRSVALKDQDIWRTTWKNQRYQIRTLKIKDAWAIRFY